MRPADPVEPIALLGGFVFGAGLALSRMARPEVVLDFLQLKDLGLVVVMLAAAGVTGIALALAPRVIGAAPATAAAYRRRIRAVDRDVLAGGAVFGVGWGLSGMCPGAAFASLGIGNYPIAVGLGGMFAGAYLHGWWRGRATGTERAAAIAD